METCTYTAWQFMLILAGVVLSLGIPAVFLVVFISPIASRLQDKWDEWLDKHL